MIKEFGIIICTVLLKMNWLMKLQLLIIYQEVSDFNCKNFIGLVPSDNDFYYLANVRMERMNFIKFVQKLPNI